MVTIGDKYLHKNNVRFICKLNLRKTHSFFDKRFSISILGQFMESYARKCPSVVHNILNEENSRKNALVLTTSLRPISTLFAGDMGKTNETIVVIVNKGNRQEDARIQKSSHLHVNVRCQESEIKHIVHNFNFTEFYVIIDSHLNAIDSRFESFVRCFINTIGHVVTKPDINVNLFTFSRKPHLKATRNYHPRNTNIHASRNFTCTDIILNANSMMGIFMGSINMYLRTFKNLYNLNSRFGTDVYFLPHVTFHS